MSFILADEFSVQLFLVVGIFPRSLVSFVLADEF